MKRIALLGGSFNPIHNAHLKLAETALADFSLAEIRFIPTKYHAFKGDSEEISDADRIHLIKLAIASNQNYQIDLTEINSSKPNYTIDYVEQLNAGNHYFFIIGMDNLLELYKWHRINDLMHRVEFICFHRPDINYVETDFIRKYKDRIHFINTIDLNIASSEIRKLIKAKKDVKDFLPDPVHRYILDQQLYCD